MDLKTVKGMQDILPVDIGVWQSVERQLRARSASFGFEEIRTPVLEHACLFARGVGEHTDVVQKEMYAFEDQSGDQLCLRPEGTAAVMRAYMQHNLGQAKPLLKLFYMGPLFRRERPQKGRYRQFHTYGVEAIGKRAPSIDVELILLGMDIVRSFDLPNPRLEINSLGNADSRAHYKKVIHDYFSHYKDDLSKQELTRLHNNPMRLLDSKNPKLQDAIAKAPSILDHLDEASQTFFDQVLDGLAHFDLPVHVNPSIVRGLDYYCDTSFEIKVDGLGSQNTVIGGGRYDRLSQTLGNKDIPASGFGMGLERLILSAQHIKAPKKISVVILPLEPKIEADTLLMAQTLRKAIPEHTIHHLPNLGSLKASLRGASKYNPMHVLMVGSQEMQTKTVTWKNFETGDQQNIDLQSLIAIWKKEQ